MSNLRPEVSHVISNQVPQFFNESAPNFIKFIEYYYKWLESSGNPLDYIRNILEEHDYDTAQSKFKLMLESGVLNNFPADTNVDKSLLIKNIKDFFRSKGSEDSFKFLFNIVFNEDVEIDWGRDLYTKSSDSEYRQSTILAIRKPKVEAVARITRGELEDIDLLYSDSGFFSTPEVFIVRDPNDDPHSNLPEVEYELSGNVTAAYLTSGGFGYDSINIIVNGDCTVPAVIDAVIVDGVITELNLISAGSGYKSLPTITFDGSGSGENAEGYLEWTAVLGSFDIIDGKQGWAKPPKVVFNGGQDTSGSVVPASAKVELTIDINGTVNYAQITDVGENYTYKPTIKWELPPNRSAIVEANLNNSKISNFTIIDAGSNYVAPPEVYITIPEYDYFKMIGHRIVQLGEDYASAIVDDVISTIINNETYYIIYLQKGSVAGEFKLNKILSTFVLDETLIAINTPLFVDIDLRHAGSGYRKGQIVSFDDEGEGGTLLVNEVALGSIDEVIIAKSGHGFVVGDPIISEGALGKGFSAAVKTIDGIGLKNQVIMELDEIHVIDNGYDYLPNDVLYIYGGNNDVSGINDTSKFAKVTIASVISSNDLREIKVNRGGYGYRYMSLAILPSVGSTSPLRQIRADGISYNNGVAEVVGSSYIIPTYTSIGSITAVECVLDDPDLNDSSVSIIVNGSGAQVSLTIVDGAIIGVVIDNIGINYVRPNLRISRGNAKETPIVTDFYTITGYAADLDYVFTQVPGELVLIASSEEFIISGSTLTFSSNKLNDAYFEVEIDEYGSITDIKVISSGLGYASNTTASIVEEEGTGALLTPILKNGGVSSLLIDSRGEFAEINKYGERKYTVLGGSGKGLELDLYYRPIRVDILDPGKYYSDYTMEVTGGHGTGFRGAPDIKSGVITGINVLTPGTGYTRATVSISSINGAKFVGIVDITGGGVSTIIIKDGGYNYDILDSVIITGDGIGATAEIDVIKDGTVKNIRILNGGAYYHHECRCRIVPSLYAPTTSAVLSPIIDNGTIKSITVVNGGEGYFDTLEIVSASWSVNTGEMDISFAIPILLNVGDEINVFGCIPSSFNGKYTIKKINLNKTVIAVDRNTNPGFYIGDGAICSKDTIVEMWYLEEDEDFDQSHVMHGIGTYDDDTPNYLGTGVDTYQYGATGTTILDTSSIWPLSGFGLVNAMFQVVDFVDIWPQYHATPKDARYKVFNDIPGVITEVEVVDGGSGYFDSSEREPLQLVVNGDGIGSSGTATANLSLGTVDSITVNTGGEYYTTAPAVVITGDGAGATAEAVLTGYVKNIDVIEYGQDYVKKPSIIIEPPIDVGGIQATAEANVTLLIPSGTFISRIEVTNPGSGYSMGTVVNIVGGGGVDAAAIPIIEDGHIIAIDLLNNGSGYTLHPTINIVDGVGVGASADAWIPCRLTSVTMIEQGSGYDKNSPPLIAAVGGYGNSAVFEPLIDYKIGEVNVIEHGSGYTIANVLFNDNNTGGYGASLLPVLKDGSFVDVIVVDGGEDYLAAEITIIGGKKSGTDAVLTPIIENGEITRVAITTAGTGYYYGTSALVVGDGENCTLKLLVDTGITSYDIKDGGLGYDDLTTVLTVTDNNPIGTNAGTGAKLIPIITDGVITGVQIIEKGYGYFNPIVTVTGSGSDAHIHAYAKRSISGARILSNGSRYTAATIKITGDGQGAFLKAKIANNSLKLIDVLYQGNRYTRQPKIIITDESNYGAISGVQIYDSGYGYRSLPLLDAESTNGRNAELIAFSNSIGKIKDIKFLDFAIGNTNEPMIRFPAALVMAENADFIENEYVYVKQDEIPDDIFAVPHAKVRKIDRSRNVMYVEDMSEAYAFKTENNLNIILENYETSTRILHENSQLILEGNILVGFISKSEAAILRFNRAYGYGVMKGMGIYDLAMIRSQSLASNPIYRLHDNHKYQDYSYIIKTGLDSNDYAEEVDKLVHPVGYALYGNVKIVTHAKVAKLNIYETKKEGYKDLSKLIIYVKPEDNLLPGATDSATKFNRYNTEYWRTENDEIMMHGALSVIQFETKLANPIPFIHGSASVPSVIRTYIYTLPTTIDPETGYITNKTQIGYDESEFNVTIWQAGVTYGYNDLVVYNDFNSPVYFSTTETLSTIDNSPVAISSVWQKFSTMPYYSYTPSGPNIFERIRINITGAPISTYFNFINNDVENLYKMYKIKFYDANLQINI